jgi:predicted cupin superfamily sugar epimerase
MADTAEAMIATLNLAPHPEGGWYRETWRAPAEGGARAGGTAILFLLEAGQRSHWHRVDAAELWLWHAGSPLAVLVEQENGGSQEYALGGDVAGGYQPQCLVPASRWQSAEVRATEARAGWALVSCVVVPGFEFDGFELAPPGWHPDSE